MEIILRTIAEMKQKLTCRYEVHAWLRKLRWKMKMQEKKVQTAGYSVQENDSNLTFYFIFINNACLYYQFWWIEDVYKVQNWTLTEPVKRVLKIQYRGLQCFSCLTVGQFVVFKIRSQQITMRSNHIV